MALCKVSSGLKILNFIQNTYVLRSFQRTRDSDRLSALVRIVFPGNAAFATNAASKTGEPNPTKFPQPQRKTTIGPKITLIAANESVSVVSLGEAQKLSKRRDLKLVKIVDYDTKTQRPVYKLMTGSEFFEEDMKRRAEKKAARNDETIRGQKLISITSRIGEHDLSSKIKNINKWLGKRYEVKMVIDVQGEMDTAEKIFSTIESETKTEGRLVQKRQKGDTIVFQLLPPKKGNDQNPKDVDRSPDDTNTETVSS